MKKRWLKKLFSLKEEKVWCVVASGNMLRDHPKRKILSGVNVKIYLFAGLFGMSLSMVSCGDSNRVLLSVSDIHFNPFCSKQAVAQLIQTPYQQWDSVFKRQGGQEISPYGQETNPKLLNVLLEAMKEHSGRVSVVVFTGDVLAHDFNDLFYSYTGSSDEKERNEFIYKTMGYVSMKFRQTFPRVPIYFSLGNNDSYEGDYALADSSLFLKETAGLFYENFVQSTNDSLIRKKDESDFLSTYPYHGYYSVRAPFAMGRCRVIGLNSVFFSVNAPSRGSKNPAGDELKWLEAQLASAEKMREKVWLLMHIPAGVNVYSTQHKSFPPYLNVVLQWRDVYNKQFVALLDRYASTVSASFAGHTHMDDYRLIYSPKDSTKALMSIHITPSVTPGFNNNPAFQRMVYNTRTASFKEITTYFINLSDSTPVFKQEYVYTNTYHFPPDVQGQDSLYRAMLRDTALLNNYCRNYVVRSPACSIRNNWQWYWCGIGNLSSQDYTKAFNSLP